MSAPPAPATPSPAGALPARWWAWAFGIATVLALMTGAGTSFLAALEGRTISTPATVALAFGTWYFWAAVVPVVGAVLRRAPLDRAPRAPALAQHLATAMALGFAHSALVATLANAAGMMSPGESWLTSLRNVGLSRLPAALFTYAGIAAALAAHGYARRARERELAEAELRAQVSQAELRALRMQLHPHFLFNTLHAINVLIGSDPATARRMVTLLGDLLRATLAGATQAEVPLRQEIAFLGRYLEIERTRFADRLAVDVRVPEELLDLPVPGFILQPLVENAVRYGIAPRPGPGRITLGARRQDGLLLLDVWNDGAPLAPGPVREGIGLSTTRQRLERMYGSAGRVTLANADGGVRATVTLPCGETPA